MSTNNYKRCRFGCILYCYDNCTVFIAFYKSTQLWLVSYYIKIPMPLPLSNEYIVDEHWKIVDEHWNQAVELVLARNKLSSFMWRV